MNGFVGQEEGHFQLLAENGQIVALTSEIENTVQIQIGLCVAKDRSDVIDRRRVVSNDQPLIVVDVRRARVFQFEKDQQLLMGVHLIEEVLEDVRSVFARSGEETTDAGGQDTLLRGEIDFLTHRDFQVDSLMNIFDQG